MGLYLAVFQGDDELEGLEVGSYEDFANFRGAVIDHLGGQPGFPVLLGHSDCDGSWSPDECTDLLKELDRIARDLEQKPPRGFMSQWQRDVAKSIGLNPRSELDCFIDVDGERLVDRFVQLCEVAIRTQQPILFQ